MTEQEWREYQVSHRDVLVANAEATRLFCAWRDGPFGSDVDPYYKAHPFPSENGLSVTHWFVTAFDFLKTHNTCGITWEQEPPAIQLCRATIAHHSEEQQNDRET